MIRRSRLAATLLLALAVLAALAGTAAARQSTRPTRMRWTTPARIDSAGSSARSLRTIDCPSSTLCLAADDSDSVLSSTRPADPGARWRVVRVDDAGGATYESSDSVTSLSCPSTRLCVGVNADGGGIVSTTRPWGGYTAWKRVTPSATAAFVGVSCPTTRLCVAVDFGGNVFVSTHPTGPASAWRHSRLAEDGHPLTAISCPTTTLCVVSAQDGTTFTSTRPASGGTTFAARQIEPPSQSVPGLEAVSCATATRCAIGDAQGDVLTSLDPGAPDPTWTTQAVASGTAIRAVGCRVSGLCVAVDTTGDAFASTGGAFATVLLASPTLGGGFTGVSCPSDALCLAVNTRGTIERSTSPAQPGSWTTAPVVTTTGPALAGVSCPTTGLCVGVDVDGNVLTTRTPTRASSWRAANIDGSTELVGVSCPSTTFCAAADGAGHVLTSHDPTGGASAWSSTEVVPPLDSGGGPNPVTLGGIACASASLCITGDEDPGEVLTTTDPTGPASGWSGRIGIGARFGGDGFNGGSCSSTHFCATISGEEVLATSAPTSPTGVNSTRTMVADNLDAISCTSKTLCTAVRGSSSAGGGGAVWRSTDPAAAHPKWTRIVRDPDEQLAVSCPTTGLCVAVDSAGQADISFQPRASRPRYVRRQVDWREPLTGVSCPTTRECVAVDQFGHAVVGRR